MNLSHIPQLIIQQKNLQTVQEARHLQTSKLALLDNTMQDRLRHMKQGLVLFLLVIQLLRLLVTGVQRLLQMVCLMKTEVISSHIQNQASKLVPLDKLLS